jgi:hypothetical protein
MIRLITFAAAFASIGSGASVVEPPKIFVTQQDKIKPSDNFF